MSRTDDDPKYVQNNVEAKCKFSYYGPFVDIWDFTALGSVHEYLDVKITSIKFTHFDG